MSTHLCSANVHANGIRQHYIRYRGAGAAASRGDPVILLPGITSPAITWGFVGERLGAALDVYILDIRGRGLSESDDSLDYSLAAQAADVIALAAALGLERYSLLGHSMGARIAARVARTQPVGLARMVLVDPPVSGPGRRPYPMQLDWYLESIRLARRGMDASAMRRFCPTWTEQELQLRAEWLHTCSERAVTASFDGFATDDFHADLRGARIPTLLMTASRGDVVRDADVRECQSLVPGLVHVRVPDAGHMIPWDNEEGFHAALGNWLGAPAPGR